MKAVIYALPSACAGGIQTRLNDLLNWKEKTVSCVPPCYDGTYFRERNDRCPLGNTPQGFSWGASRHHRLHIIRFRCDASSHTILRFCGNPVLLLVTSAASSAAGGGLLGGLITGAASGGRSGVRLLVPAKEIGKRHID